MKKFRTVMIGLGGRGDGLYRGALKQRDYVDFAGICDTYPDRCESLSAKMIEDGRPAPVCYTDYRKCIDEIKPEVVIIATSWSTHVEVAMYAMERGAAVACEVGGAYSIHNLWELVRCYERTGSPFMFLENCCYDRIKLLALQLKRFGELGEMVHCEGKYSHDLRKEICTGAEQRHYRLEQYIHRNAENYPTHEIGPIAKLLDINCGNRFTSLISIGSKSVGLEAYVNSRNIESLKGVKFRQSDVVTTILKCANGETVTIALDTCLPRFYARSFVAQGTKGIVSEDLNCVLLDEIPEKEINWKKIAGNIDEYYEKYDHPLWKQNSSYEKMPGHGGMDVMVFDEFFRALNENAPMPIDVYDMATWAAITILSEESLATGLPVAFPDFTDGKWIHRKNTFAL